MRSLGAITLTLGWILACSGPRDDDDPDTAIEEEDFRYCGQRSFNRRIDPTGSGAAEIQRAEDSSCWRYQVLADDSIHVFHRIPETDGPPGDGYCLFGGRKTGTFVGEITDGYCIWANSTTQFRFEVSDGEVDDPGDGFVTVVVRGRMMDLVGDQVVHSPSASFVFFGGENSPADPALFPGDEGNTIEPVVCERDGCWEGELEATIVGSPACDVLLDNFPPGFVQRFEVADGGRRVSHDGVDLDGFASVTACETYATEGAFPTNQWRYTLVPDAAGSAITLHQFARIDADPLGIVDCEVIWQGDWSTCP